MSNKKKILAGVAIGLMILALSFGLRTGPLFDSQQQNLSAQLYKGRALGEEIVIVAIDEKSLSNQAYGGLNGFNQWARTYYGDVLERIESGRPSSVLFDILFSSESSGIGESDLMNLVSTNPEVTDFAGQILEYLARPHPYDQYFADVLEKYDNVYLIKNYLGDSTWNGKLFEVKYEETAIEPLANSAKSGFASVIDTEEGENSSMIFAIPVGFSLNGGDEKQVDFQLVENHLGKIIEAPDEKGQMLINYAAPSYSYPMVSFSDVYYGLVDPGIFEGKIVLIGATAAILQDRHFTPIDKHRPMPGIEIHANAIQTILDETYLRYQSDWGFLGMVALMALVAVGASLFLPILRGSLVVALELAAFPFLAQWSFNRGIIIDLIWPVAAAVLAYFAVLTYRNFTEFAEKRNLKTAFSRYVSPELADKITEQPELLQLGGERRVITAFFLDIENFTTLSEGLEPKEVVGIINTYFSALAEVIMAHGGSVDKYEGDAIMALFGAPVPSQDHAKKACHAALAIRDRMTELNASSGHNLNIRIGLATGEAIVGNMGSARRFDYTAMGDIVNTASRLEGANKFYGTRVLVNPGTAEAASGIVFRNVDKVQLKGKIEAISIHEILGSMENVAEAGLAVVEEWNKGLEAYQKGEWDIAERQFKKVLDSLPEDGPSKTLLARIAELKMLYGAQHIKSPSGRVWDGVWRFESK